MEACDRCHYSHIHLVQVLLPYEGKTESWCLGCLGKAQKEAMGE